MKKIRKFCYPFFLILACSLGRVSAQSYYLLPESFFPERGQEVKMSMFSEKGFDSRKAKGIPASQFRSAMMYAGGKPVNLLPEGAKGAGAELAIKPEDQGLCLVSARKDLLLDALDREEVIRQLSDEGFNALAEKAGDKEEMALNNILYAKALVMNSKASGKCYEENTGQDLEVLLMQNPYKLKYGEDITVQILFKGKPLTKARAEVYTRTINGSVIPSESSSDSEGKVYIKLNRAGDWMLKVTHIEPSEKDGEYTRWCSSYTFGFRQ